MKRNLPVYAVQLDDTEDTGIFAMSFVEQPAVERNFVALAKARPLKLRLNHDKQILTGVVLMPNQPIYRDESFGQAIGAGGACNIVYSAAQIEKIQERLMRNGIALSSTTHEHERPLRGNYLIECWIVADPENDKANALGLGKLPKGTLCASYKVTDRAYWVTQVKSGKVKGFSLEGLFNFNKINMARAKTTRAVAKQSGAKNMGLIAKAFRAVFLEGDTVAETEELVNVAEADTVDAGEPLYRFWLADDAGEVHVDEEFFATIDGEQMAAGEHLLDTGDFLIIDEDGYMVEATDEPAEEETAAAEAALKRADDRAAAYLASQNPKTPASRRATPAARKTTKQSSDSKEVIELRRKLAAAERKNGKKPTAQKVVQKTQTPVDRKNMKPWQLKAEMLKDKQARKG